MFTQFQRTLAFAVTVALFSLTAMVFSYRLAYNAARSGVSPVLREQHEKQAERLRALRDDMVRLASVYVERSKQYPGPGTPEFSQWLNQDFMPKFNDMRRRLLEADLPAEPLAALLQASEKLSAAVSQPERGDLRVTAADDALEAASVVDSFLSGWENSDRG